MKLFTSTPDHSAERVKVGPIRARKMSANTPHGTDVTLGRYVELTQEAEVRIKHREADYTLSYPFTNRKVTNLWPASTIARPPPPKPLTYTLNEQEPPRWPREQYMIANENKSIFFDQASSRVPPHYGFVHLRYQQRRQQPDWSKRFWEYQTPT